MLSNARAFFSLVVVAVTATSCVGQVQMNCFAAGPAFDCFSFALAFCSTIGNSSVRPTDSIIRCFEGPAAATQCLFTTVNTLTANSIPNTANCLSALEEVDTNCPFGGSGQIVGDNFRFWMDTKTGACPRPNLS
ncbi:hypothetical protein C8R44DRAFT_893815 [Mycena epipterygia]|nr:hypothetical protein C8R44DRAFT_893815 [Mycena epipterygia]